MTKIKSILKPSLVVFGISLTGNISSYIFQFFMSRHLETAEFGILNTLFALMVTASVPARTILMVVSNYTAKFKARAELSKLRSLYYNVLKKISTTAILGVAVAGLFTGQICKFLVIPSRYPLIMAGIALAFAFTVQVNLGMLQGLQKFYNYGFGLSSDSVLRLLFGVAIVYMGFGLNGAMTAVVLATSINFGLTCIPIQKIINHNQDSQDIKLKELFGYGLPVMLAAFFFMGLINSDLILVKHYFSPTEAGIYSVVVLLGRIAFFLSMNINAVVFPIISELHTVDKDVYGVLKYGLLLTLLVCGSAAGLYFLIPEVLLKLMFGAKFIPAAPLLKIFGLAILPFTLVNHIMEFFLARHRTAFIYSLLAGFILQITLIWRYHQTLTQVIHVMMLVGTGLLLTNLGLVILEKRQET